MALYNKYRPHDLSMICGQENIKRSLVNQIRSGNLANAYLFIGGAGTGKTTCARIFTAMVNAKDGMTEKLDPSDEFVKAIMSGRSGGDVTEMDAASNNGVDEARALREHAVYAPLAMRKKVWIIDECHKLTTQAWQALLKILEEPPSCVMFIFCTTEPGTIPETIWTRVMPFKFQAVSVQEMLPYLKKIISLEKIDIADEAVTLLAKSAQGSVRQALANLDKLVAAGQRIDAKLVASEVGIASRSCIMRYLRSTVVGPNFVEGLAASSEALSGGVDIKAFIEDVALLMHDLVIQDCPGGYSLESAGYSEDEVKEIRALYQSIKDLGVVDPRQALLSMTRQLNLSHSMTVFNQQPQAQADVLWTALAKDLRSQKRVSAAAKPS